MSTDYTAIANAAATAANAPQAGVVVVAVPDGRNTFFSIYGARRDGALSEHRLDCTCTDLARLTAHVQGFVANHLRAWA